MKIEKPIYRSQLRQVLGREYYILRRKQDWFLGGNRFAKEKGIESFQELIYKHQSLILRPLQGVDMQLQINKRTNLDIAISHLNGIVIKPGETFSFWKLVGRPKKRKGYLNGLVLKQGEAKSDVGGGLCQLGNLLFWMVAHSPLNITERHRHGFDVFPDVNRKVPFGAGATLSYNHIDLQFKNETDISFQLSLWLDETHLHGELKSNQKIESKFYIEERNHIFKQQTWGRYSRHNQIVQVETMSSGEQNEKLLVENHAIMMYSPFIEK